VKLMMKTLLSAFVILLFAGAVGAAQANDGLPTVDKRQVEGTPITSNECLDRCSRLPTHINELPARR